MTDRPGAQPLRVLIVEDEPPARRRLRSLLQRHDDVTIVGEAAHGGEAVELIQRDQPDVVLLDVELPVANGFEVIDAVGPANMPDVIFVTAYDHYAIRAFDVHALDYLLKTVESERLGTALGRARARLAPRRPDATPLGRAMDDLRQLPVVRRIPVRHGDRLVELQPLFHGEYVVRLKDGTKLTSGRSYRDQMRSALRLKPDD